MQIQIISKEAGGRDCGSLIRSTVRKKAISVIRISGKRKTGEKVNVRERAV